MTRRLLTILDAGSLLAACDWFAKPEDVLAGNTTKVVYATTQCTVPNDDGVRCDKKTCKKDARSDCSVFIDRCTQAGHAYEGNADEGACIRGDQVG
ncbi:MAG: hypothetical protein ACLGHC_04285 [Alphaproteobacteria bacterium]